MKEHPILFNGDMVRAILEGRKTQTRRVVKPKHGGKIIAQGGPGIALEQRSASELNTVICPYGKPGDRLWVRETFDPIYGQSPPDRVIEIDYKADWIPHGNRWRMMDELGTRRWRPSIHMPRWASRILLEITGVRVERLLGISDADAQLEGIEYSEAFNGYCIGMAEHFHSHDPRQSYFSLWETINGPGNVETNPWVWVVEFKRIEGGAA